MKAGNPWHLDPPPRNRRFLRWSGYLLCLIGIGLLSYCGYVLLEAKLYQVYQSRRFEEALKSSRPPAAASESPVSPTPAAPTDTATAAVEGAVIPVPDLPLGRIEIKRIGIAAMIMEGIDKATLRRAVGHFPQTVLPGRRGNVAIAGHRDTFFRALQDIRQEDEITLTTLHGTYRYRVDSTLVVEPREIWVLKDTDSTTLTLVTCYPFNFVGPAPQRFIVRALKISE